MGVLVSIFLHEDFPNKRWIYTYASFSRARSLCPFLSVSLFKRLDYIIT